MSFFRNRGTAGAIGASLDIREGGVVLILAIASALPVFWSGTMALADAWATPEYSHGPIIPLISTFLFLREMRRGPPTSSPITDRWPGVAVVFLGLLIGVIGNLARINDIVMYGLIVWVAGLVLTLFGFRRGCLFWPAVLHLIFMLPLPQFVYWQVSVFLQVVSSEIGVAVISFIGVPVYLDGNIIDLGVYKLQVAEACSGLRYLYPMLSFTYVFAVLYNGPVWHKILLLMSAAPITVLMNSFRISVIGVMVNNFGIEYAEGFLHTFEGWVIFISCVVILFGMVIVLQQLQREPKRLSEALDIEFEGLGEQLGRVRDVSVSPALIAAIVLTAGVSGAWLITKDRDGGQMAASRAPLAVMPDVIGGRRGSLHPPLTPEIERILDADDYYTGYFQGSEGAAPIDLFIAYYADQTQSTGIHSPEVCLPTGGWEVSAWDTLEIERPDGAPIRLNRAVIQKGLTRQLVYFWFDLRGKTISGSFEAKIHNLWDLITLGRSDGALVRMITPLAPGEDPAEADARLSAFVLEVKDILPRFVPL
jgi:exosortase D (VPLPA-CTERM-specific)